MVQLDEGTPIRIGFNQRQVRILINAKIEIGPDKLRKYVPRHIFNRLMRYAMSLEDRALLLKSQNRHLKDRVEELENELHDIDLRTNGSE